MMMNTLLVSKRDSLCHSSGDSDDCLSEDGRGSYQSASMVATSSSAVNPGRKRRRGIIEKRRRDRINQSLTELKRLVPAALEKSNSAKLEKAEILQMTVEHLKMVGGGNGAVGRQYTDPYEAHRIAVDYHLIGFKECAAEVARYLTVEGMEIPEQARVRLVTHLQMFASQKECYAAGSRTAAYHNSSASAATTAQQSPPAPAAPSTQSSWQTHNPYPAYTPNCYPTAGGESHESNKAMEGHAYFGHHYNGQSFNQATVTPPPPTGGNPSTSVAPSTSSYFSPFTTPAASTSTAPTSVTSSSYPSSPYPTSAKGQQPPYRPWGAEMASC